MRPVRGISSSCMIPGPGGITPAALHRPASGSWIRVAEACHSQTGLIMSPLPQDASTSWAMASPRCLGLGPPGTLLQCQRHKQNGTPSSEVCGTAPPASSRFLTFSSFLCSPSLWGYRCFYAISFLPFNYIYIILYPINNSSY